MAQNNGVILNPHKFHHDYGELGNMDLIRGH